MADISILRVIQSKLNMICMMLSHVFRVLMTVIDMKIGKANLRILLLFLHDN